MSLRNYSRSKSAQLWVLALFLIVLVLSFKFPVGQKLSIAIAPLLHVVQTPAQWTQDFLLWFKKADELQNQYQLLQQTTLKQQALKLELTALRTENTQLRQLLSITQIDGYMWHAARVMSRGLEAKSRRLMIQTERVNDDDVVVSHEGVVGLIDHAGSEYAVVRTILDASLAVPVTMENSDLAGLVRGDGAHLLVDFIPLTKAPQVGDILLTSGAGGLFPAGLPIAVVEEVKQVEGGVFAEVIARPAAYWQRDAWLAVARRVQSR